MAKRRRIIEGTWTCSSCDTEGILGRHKICPNCGNPRDSDGSENQFDFGEKKASGASKKTSVTDKKALSAAKAGEDWFCTYCNSSNPGSSLICTQCQAPREEAALEKPEISTTQPKDSNSLAPKLGLIAIAVFIFICAGCCGFSLWGTQTVDIEGNVSAMEWKHRITLEEFQPIRASGWKKELQETPTVFPINGTGERAGVANIQDCISKRYSSRSIPIGEKEVCRNKTEKYQCGTEEKCTVKDLKNGFAEEVCEDIPKYCTKQKEVCKPEMQYRKEPILEQWCTYDSYAWKSIESREKKGADNNPQWPDISDLKHIRAERKATYRIEFSAEINGKPKNKEITPKTEAEFRSWKLGQKVALKKNKLGQLVLPKDIKERATSSNPR